MEKHTYKGQTPKLWMQRHRRKTAWQDYLHGTEDTCIAICMKYLIKAHSNQRGLVVFA